MDCDAAGEGVVDGGVLHIGWRVVASLLIHISSHMEMNGVMPHCLLAHVLQFQTFNVGSLKIKTNLENKRRAVKKDKNLLRARRGNTGIGRAALYLLKDLLCGGECVAAG